MKNYTVGNENRGVAQEKSSRFTGPLSRAVEAGERVMNEGHHAPLPEQGRSREADLDDALIQIRQALNGLRYGQVTVVVQDGIVVQIDRTEKRRRRRPGGDENR